MEEIHQAYLTAIKKNPTIINAVETDSKYIYSKNLTKLHNDLFRINSNQIELTADRKVIASSKGSKKDFSSVGIWLKGFINYSIII